MRHGRAWPGHPWIPGTCPGMTRGGGGFMAGDVGGLGDTDRGLISRRIFIEPEIYEQEQRQVFARCWLFLCHDSQVALPGDFFTTTMGEDPVLVTRDTGGQVHKDRVLAHRGG